MKQMSVGEFKSHFSEVIEQVKAGEEIAVTYGKKKEIVGYFSPEKDTVKKKRDISVLAGKGTAVFKDDFEITEEEFLGL